MPFCKITKKVAWILSLKKTDAKRVKFTIYFEFPFEMMHFSIPDIKSAYKHEKNTHLKASHKFLSLLNVDPGVATNPFLQKKQSVECPFKIESSPDGSIWLRF